MQDQRMKNKKPCYREEHSASVVLIVGVLYDILWEKISVDGYSTTFT